VDTLGRNGVTSNYRYDLAPYTWELVKGLKQGRAIFTQPPMPIKCAGAPQKALYLSGDHWHRSRRARRHRHPVHECRRRAVRRQGLCAGADGYIDRYNAELNFFHNLVAIDGPAKKAWFEVKEPEPTAETVEVEFDMIHVVPAADRARFHPRLAAGRCRRLGRCRSGTLRHKTFDNIWSLGDVMNAPNAKTAAAARKQAPVVAENVAADIDGPLRVAHL
jgi:sulfide:quinone oxidoreductase